MTIDTLRCVNIDGFDCSDLDNPVGMSQNLQKLVLNLKCTTRTLYANSVNWFLNQIKNCKFLEAVIIQPKIEILGDKKIA